MILLSQLFGAGAITCSLIIYSRRSKQSLLLFKCAQDCFWLVHYLLLATYPAAATSALCVSRSLVFRKTGNKGQSNRWVLAIYLALYAASAALTWKNLFSLLPAISSSISTVAFWVPCVKYTKYLSIGAALCTLCYNLLVAHSVTVYIGVCFTVTTSVISLISQRKERMA
jgi:hypothetical protein